MHVVFLNTAAAKCSIHESGRMVAACLHGSNDYELTYITIDQLDSAALNEGRLEWADATAREALQPIDAMVVNWHVVTMPLSDEVIARLPGLKLAIVLEAAPGDPLALTPVKAFDAYLVLDPTLPDTDKVYSFPRPLSVSGYVPRPSSHQSVRIGSFGFGTPGKGFELLVEAVNREFDRAEILVNIPSGDFISTDLIHDESYVEHIARTMRAIAKPGIDVTVTTHFYSPNELIDWCAANDLNCFMYTREQPGLSATTDQAIISGRPLLTIGNPTFRHITHYLPPYPRQSLRDAIEKSVPAVHAMQKAWSPTAFRGKFERVLRGDLPLPCNKGLDDGELGVDIALRRTAGTKKRIVVVTLGQPAIDDAYDFACRFVAALERSGAYEAVNLDGLSIRGALAVMLANRPYGVVLIGAHSRRSALTAAIHALLPMIRVIEADWMSDGGEAPFPLRPIIPFRTVDTPLSLDPAVIMLGYGHDAGGALRTLRLLAREEENARVLIDCPAAQIESMRQAIGQAKSTSRSLCDMRIDIIELPRKANDILGVVSANRAVIAQQDRNDPQDLLNKLSLAYITERPILISGDAPVPFFAQKTAQLGKVMLREIEPYGVASRIGSVMDYGEWALVEAIGDALERSWPDGSTPASISVGEVIFGLLDKSDDHGVSSLDVSTTGKVASDVLRHLLADFAALQDGSKSEFITRLYWLIMRREPDNGGALAHLNELRIGHSRAARIGAFLGAPEYSTALTRVAPWTQHPQLLSQFPSLPLLLPWLWGLCTLEDTAFMAELGKISEYLGLQPPPASAAASPEQRLEAIAEFAHSAGYLTDTDFVAQRTELWSRLSDQIEACKLGIVREAPPPKIHISIPPLSEDFPSTPTAREYPRRAENIFGQPQPSRLFSGVEPIQGPVDVVYLLVEADGGVAPAYIAELSQRWPLGAAALRQVAWNRVRRRLELIDAQQRIDLASSSDRGCAVLAIPAGLLVGEPMGLVAPISEARRRQWRVAIIADAADSGTADASAVERAALHQRAFALADRIIATSALATRQIQVQLGVPTTFLPPVVTLSDLDIGVDSQRFLNRIAAHLVVTTTSTPLPSIIVYRHTNIAASIHAVAELRALGLAVVEWTGEAPEMLPPHVEGHAVSWVIADGVTDANDLSSIRAFAAERGLATAYLGRVADGAEALRRELLDWDIALVTNAGDFTAMTNWLRRTRLRVCDAESRFLLIDHPGMFAAAPMHLPVQPPIIVATTGSGALPRLVSANGDYISLVVLDGQTVEQQAKPQIGAWLASGSHEEISVAAREAAYAGLPLLVQQFGDVPPRAGALLLLADATGALVVPDGAELARASLEAAKWTEGVRAAAARELAASLTRAAPPRLYSPTPYPRNNVVSSHPLLSLCISTYNRSDWLALNLRNIYREINPEDEDIEILVVDNFSNDKTPSVCQDFSAHKNFRAIRNEVNVGMLGNLAVTAQYASGEYLWILGDDDLIREGVIRKALNVLKKNIELDLIYFNYGYTSINEPWKVIDPREITKSFNLLEPAGSDRTAMVADLAANSENFYTAIYAIIFRREFGFRAYCLDTSGRPFSTLATCVPSARYALGEMANCKAYWFGEPSLVVNSNVSWQAYGPLFDLEQLPRVWDLAEVAGAPSAEVDKRRANRLWLIELMWREMLLNDSIGNQAYFDPIRVLIRLKHLLDIDKRIPTFRKIYEEAHRLRQPAARRPPELVFEAWND